MTTARLLSLISSASLGLGTSASAALYAMDFEVDDSANWALNNGPSDAAANYYFDYSTVGIPAAPGGAGTRGMKLQANLSSGVFGGMSTSPTNAVLPSTYTLTFDWWANTVGSFPVGGSGSTNLSTFGVGTAGGTAQWPGGTQDSVWFAATGDGGSGSDYRAYSTAAATSYTFGSGVYAAGTQATALNNSDAYYSILGNVAPPVDQATLFPNQTGNVQTGAAAFAWHEVEINYGLTDITWTVDGLLIATVDRSTVTLGGTNIFFGHSDINAGSSTDVNDAALLFTLIDNIQVVPEPSSALLGLVGAALLFRRRRSYGDRR